MEQHVVGYAHKKTSASSHVPLCKKNATHGISFTSFICPPLSSWSIQLQVENSLVCCQIWPPAQFHPKGKTVSIKVNFIKSFIIGAYVQDFVDFRIEDLIIVNLGIEDLRIKEFRIGDLRIEGLRIEDLRIKDLRIKGLKIKDLGIKDLRIKDLK